MLYAHPLKHICPLHLCYLKILDELIMTGELQDSSRNAILSSVGPLLGAKDCVVYILNLCTQTQGSDQYETDEMLRKALNDTLFM
jgi:hypothetical protein